MGLARLFITFFNSYSDFLRLWYIYCIWGCVPDELSEYNPNKQKQSRDAGRIPEQPILSWNTRRPGRIYSSPTSIPGPISSFTARDT